MASETFCKPSIGSLDKDFWIHQHCSRHGSNAARLLLADANSLPIWVSAGAAAITADYKWGQHTRILDIGGASGSFLSLIMNRHDVKGAVCDVAQVRTSKLAGFLPELDDA